MSPGCSPPLLDSGTVTTPEIPDEPTGSPTGAAARRGPLRPGDRVQLTDPRGRLHTITLAPGATFHTHKGYFRHDDLIGGPEGSVVVSTGGVAYLALRPLLADFVLSMPRGAAVVYPKDACPGVDVAHRDDLARVLGVHHGGTPWHGEHEVRQQRSQRQIGHTAGADHDGALRSADQVVVAEVPLVRVEGRARRQRDGVQPAARVGELHPVPRPQRSAPGGRAGRRAGGLVRDLGGGHGARV